MNETRELWGSICSAFRFPTSSLGMLDDLIAMYGDQQRYYHNWKHVEACLKKLESYSYDRIENYTPPAFGRLEYMRAAYALIMHDAVYDTRSPRNEENSAFLASAIAGSTFANDLILGTKKHKLSKDNTQNVVNDIDMSILGSPKLEYQGYIGNIRQEHCFISNEGFAHGRAEWVQSTLASPIFHTSYYFDKYEDQARKNLKLELFNMGIDYVAPKEPSRFY